MPTDRQRRKELIALYKRKENSLEWHHEVGRRVRELWQRHPYGAHFTSNLAQELGTSTSYLIRAMQFAELYPAEQVAGLAPLTWMQITVLLPIDAGPRAKLVEQAKAGTWTVARLEEEITKKVGPRRARKRGSRRKHRSLGMAGDAYELLRRTTAWVDYVEDVWAGRHQKVGARDEDQLLTLQELRAVLAQAQEHIGDLRSRLRSARQPRS